MTRKSFIDTAVPRLKQYMAEKGRPITTRESAEFLGVTPSSAGDVMFYMETVDIVQRVKRGGKNYYFLKGSFDEREIDSMRARADHRPAVYNLLLVVCQTMSLLSSRLLG